MNCFKFELPLSEFLPSTFLGELGGTQYLGMVAVRYENSLGQLDQISNPRENANFNVIGISDLNMQPAQIRVSSFSRDLIHCYRPQTKFAKVMFSQVSVCPRGVSVSVRGGLHPRGISVQGGL